MLHLTPQTRLNVTLSSIVEMWGYRIMLRFETDIKIKITKWTNVFYSLRMPY
jgi:hypothetical protein